MKHFTSIIKQLRIEHNLSQAELAKLLGLSRSAVANYENGSRNPDKDTLVKFANLFHVSLDYLLGRNSGFENYAEILSEIDAMLNSAPLPQEKKTEIVEEMRDYFTWKIDQARKNHLNSEKE